MKKLLTLLFGVTLFCGVMNPAQAQQKDWAIGLRLGEPLGINVKRYLSNGNALDINLGSYGAFYGNSWGYKGGYWRRGVALMVNYVWQKQIPGAKGLQWYYGLGGQLASRKYYWYAYDNKHKWYYENEETRVSLGVTGMIGLEYFIPRSPVSLFVDASPYLEVFPDSFSLNVQAGIGGRFNF